MPNSVPVSQEFIDGVNRMAVDLKRALAWIDNLRVSGADLTNTPTGATITVKPASKETSGTTDPEFFAFTNGHTQDSTNLRYFYGWAVAEITDQGYGHWQAKTGGATGTSTDADKRAINLSEEINGATGLTGTGITFPLATSAATLQPIPDGMPVRMRRTVTTNGKVQYVIVGIGAPNGIDGPCTADE